MTQTELANILGVKSNVIQNKCNSTNRETRIVFNTLISLPDVTVKPVLEDVVSKDESVNK